MEGSEFLKKRYELHKAEETKAAAVRTKKRTGENVPQKPEAQIQNYFDRLKEIIERKDPETKERGIRALKKVLYDTHVIKPEDVPESYFEHLQKIAREEGRGDIEITDAFRHAQIETIITDQKSTLNLWIDYFASGGASAFPDWAKYWAFRSMLSMSTYDKETHQFAKRSKGTAALYPDLNQEALDKALEFIEKKTGGKDIQNPIQVGENQFAAEGKLISNEDFQKLLDTKDFAKYYAFAIEHVTADNSELFKITEGEWRVFKRGSDHMDLIKTLQGHGTGWLYSRRIYCKTKTGTR